MVYLQLENLDSCKRKQRQCRQFLCTILCCCLLLVAAQNQTYTATYRYKCVRNELCMCVIIVDIFCAYVQYVLIQISCIYLSYVRAYLILSYLATYHQQILRTSQKTKWVYYSWHNLTSKVTGLTHGRVKYIYIFEQQAIFFTDYFNTPIHIPE